MTTQLQAVFENGLLRPLQPLALAERQCVTITITEASVDLKGAPDETYFVLSPERWEAFCALLDRPPKEIPALRKLLTQPSVLDGNRQSS
jgi:predicted DNA-binding antitoxin AbrB/MazE fold protein